MWAVWFTTDGTGPIFVPGYSKPRRIFEIFSPWSSVYARPYGNEKQLLSRWPVAAPGNYLEWLNYLQLKDEIENIRYSLKRSRPYGSEPWVSTALARFRLENTLRDPWRPEKGTGTVLLSLS